MTHVTCRLTAKNRDQLRNPTLCNRVWATRFHIAHITNHRQWIPYCHNVCLKTKKLPNFVKAFEQNTENNCAGVSSYFSLADISTLQVNSAGLFIRPSRPWRMAPELFGVPATPDQNSGLDLTVKENYCRLVVVSVR